MLGLKFFFLSSLLFGPLQVTQLVSARFCLPHIVCPDASTTDTSSPLPTTRALHNEKRASLQDSLFPPAFTYSKGFTTASGVSLSGVESAKLDDSALNIVKVQSGMTHAVVQQDGKTAWEAVYPKGSFNPSHQPLGGFGFYVGGTPSFASALSFSSDVLLSYSLFLQPSFAWNKGGKLPGPFGGPIPSAYGCSGGRQDGRSSCFGARLMWRAEGVGELYTYLPLTDSNKAAQEAVKGTVVNDDYGFSVGRGAFTWPTGQWVTIAERVKLSSSSTTNDGIDLQNVAIPGPVQGFQFQTFFGGATSDYASPQDQKAWFADVSGAIIASGGNGSASTTSAESDASSGSGTASSKSTGTESASMATG